MEKRPASTLDITKINTPAFVIEEALLRHNLSILKHVKDATKAKMFQALKTWATWELFTIVEEYLDGTEVSSLNEARLGYEHFNHEVHMYSPAYKEEEFEDVLKYTSTLIFNSFDQWRQFKARVNAFDSEHGTTHECGLRINPEQISPDEHGGLWSPTAPGSRLGIRESEFKSVLEKDPNALEGISGLHFHIFFDKELPELEEAVGIIEKKFGAYLPGMKWINWGGGQKITDDGYDVEGLIRLINTFQKKHSLTVHMEPGAAIVKQAGSLVSTVLDIVKRDDVPYEIVILDMSFNAHTPDFLLSSDLDMSVRGAEIVREETDLTKSPHPYRLAGGTCVTGDQLGHFHTFQNELKNGDKIVMEDGIQYNMVQCTMFNGVQHPAINVLRQDGKVEVLREFDYEDYKTRMG